MHQTGTTMADQSLALLDRRVLPEIGRRDAHGVQELPEAYTNTLAVAERCKSSSRSGSSICRYQVPDGFTLRFVPEHLA